MESGGGGSPPAEKTMTPPRGIRFHDARACPGKVPAATGRGELTSHGQLLHRPTDLRHGAGAPHAPDRRHLHRRSAGLALSRHRAAPGADHGDLHRRRCPDRRRFGDHADRAESQRRQRHDLHVVGQHQQRPLANPGNARRRLQPGHRGHRRPEQGRYGQAHPSSRSDPGWSREQEDHHQHGLRGQSGQPQRDALVQLSGQLRPDQHRRSAQANSRDQRPVRLRPEVRHAHLARSGQDGQPADFPGRGDRGDQVGKPSGRRGQDRCTADGRRGSGSSSR